MDDILQNILKIIYIVEFIMGNLGNGFLVLVNCMNWVKRQKISFLNHILTALAFSRIALLWSLVIIMAVSSLYPALVMNSKVKKMIQMTLTVTNHFSIWLTASLSMFYFLKIANFSNSIFLYLKWRVKKVISLALLVSLFLLFLNIFLLNIHTDVWIDGYTTDMSYNFSLSELGEYYRSILIINMIFLSTPTTIALSAFLLLIISLWKHLKKMKHNTTGPKDAGTMAHVKALQTMITSVVLFTILLLVAFAQILRVSALLEKKVFISFSYAVVLALPSLHTWVLILGNSKLRQASLSVLWYLTRRSRDVETSSP